MYVSGSIYTFLPRLHQLALTTGDLASFRVEDNIYSFPSGLKQHVNKEYQKKYYTITDNPASLTSWYF